MLRKSTRLANLPAKSYRLRPLKPLPKSSNSKIKKRSSLNVKKQVRSIKEGQDHLSIKTTVKSEQQIESSDPTHQTTIITRSEALTTAILPRKYDVEKAWRHIKQTDTKLALIMDDQAFAEFKQRIKLVDGSNPFKSLVTSIIYQQIHGKAAASIRNRFLRLFEFESPISYPDADLILPNSFPWFPTPEMILAKSTEELRSAGLSQRKAEYIQDLSTKFANKTIRGERLDSMADDDISKLLCSVKGIGQWTVDMFLMFNLCHPDVLPISDLGVKKGVALHFNTVTKKDKKNQPILPSAEEMYRLTECWKPYRTLGSWLMWRMLEIKTVADD